MAVGHDEPSQAPRTPPQENPEDPPCGDREGSGAGERGSRMTKISDLHHAWMGDPEYRAAYEALEEETLKRQGEVGHSLPPGHPGPARDNGRRRGGR